MSLKHIVRFLFLGLIFISSFFAFSEQRIYRMNVDQNKFGNQFSAQLQSKQTQSKYSDSNLKFIDSIPQLGIVLMAKAHGENSGAEDLGQNRMIRLNLPKTQKRMSVPSGFWGLNAIEVGKAWQKGTGAGVVVAVSDTGVDAGHKDLAKNMWVNTGESGLDSQGRDKKTNGIDDDNNGYIDDVNGWNFVTKTNGNSDNQYHGTHVAGTIAAAYSDKMSGVAPDAKIMNVAFLSASGGGTEFNGAKTIVYAADNGAKIINCSWGGEGDSPVIEEAIKYAEQKGVIVVAAAGNAKKNIDKTVFTPAAIKLDNVISVAATSGASGNKASYSNFGKVNVDLAAPGSNILSLAPKNRTKRLSGTSMAAPHVSGVAALLLSVNKDLAGGEIKEILMGSVVIKSNWKNKTQTGGILNANSAVNSVESGSLRLAEAF